MRDTTSPPHRHGVPHGGATQLGTHNTHPKRTVLQHRPSVFIRSLNNALSSTPGTRWRSGFEAMSYMPEGRGFDFRWGQISSFGPHYGPEADSASNTNEYHRYLLEGKGGRCRFSINSRSLNLLQP